MTDRRTYRHTQRHTATMADRQTDRQLGANLLSRLALRGQQERVGLSAARLQLRGLRARGLQRLLQPTRAVRVVATLARLLQFDER